MTHQAEIGAGERTISVVLGAAPMEAKLNRVAEALGRAVMER